MAAELKTMAAMTDDSVVADAQVEIALATFDNSVARLKQRDPLVAKLASEQAETRRRKVAETKLKIQVEAVAAAKRGNDGHARNRRRGGCGRTGTRSR